MLNDHLKIGSLCVFTRDVKVNLGLIPCGTVCVIVDIDEDLTERWSSACRANPHLTKDRDEDYRFYVYTTVNPSGKPVFVAAVEIDCISRNET